MFFVFYFKTDLPAEPIKENDRPCQREKKMKKTRKQNALKSLL